MSPHPRDAHARGDEIFTTATADTAALRAQFGDIRLTPPTVRAGVLGRASLIARTQRTSLVVVEAAAGYGKTTLLADWAAREERAVAWVSLTPRDDDPGILVELIATALCDAIPEAGSLIVQAARGGRDVLSNAAPMLASAVRGAPNPFVLFLDDVHALSSPPCHEVLELLASALPEGSTLVLAGRGRLAAGARARLAVASRVLTAVDLRLTDREALALAGAADDTIDTVAVRTWVERCDGWATGIRLLSQAASGAPAHEDLPADAARLVGDYLDREVLATLDAETHDLLVSCSVLDTVTPDLADAVRGRGGSAPLLRALAEGQCFISPCHVPGSTYRVHPLVRDHVRAELEARGRRAVAEAHRRAAQWYVETGRPDAAMDHWIDAGAFTEAAALLADLGLPLYHAGRAAQLQRWIAAIGELHVFAFPPAALMAALLEMVAGDPVVAARRIRLLDTVDVDDMDAPAAAHFVSSRALLKAMQAREGVEAARVQARAALELQGPLNPWRDAALGVYGHLLARAGRDVEARSVCIEALDLAPTFGHHQTLALCGAELALLSLAEGELDAATEWVQTALRAIDDYDLDDRPASVTARAVAALVHHRGGNREGAARFLTLAMPRRDALTRAVPTVSALTRLVLAEVKCAFGEFDEAELLVREATEALAQVPERGDLDARLSGVRDQIADAQDRGHFGASAALTSAERRLLPLLQTHLTREQIAQTLHVSRNTVGTQMTSIFRKLGVASRTAAVAHAQELGML